MVKTSINDELKQLVDKEARLLQRTLFQMNSSKPPVPRCFVLSSISLTNVYSMGHIPGAPLWLHKKGDTYNPNNYPAIAVASNLGKLFSSILLRRLIAFRSMTNPDTPNQLGFCKNAQTADHTLTLTPLHKKGDTYNPNNYPAIAVASNLGKFSSILLRRLIAFRSMTNPDTPNQLGFCKNAQTADHINTHNSD